MIAQEAIDAALVLAAFEINTTVVLSDPARVAIGDSETLTAASATFDDFGIRLVTEAGAPTQAELAGSSIVLTF